MIRDIFVYLLAFMMAYKIIKKPIFGFYCSVFFLPFGKLALFNFGNNGFLYIYFLVILTFLSELFKKNILNEKIPNIFLDTKYLIIISLLAYCVFSIFLSYKIPFAIYKGEIPYLRSIKQVMLFSFAILFYYQVIYYVRDYTVLKKIFKIYISAYGFLVFICIIEFFNYYFTNPVTTFLFNFWHNSSTGSGIFELFMPVLIERGAFPRLRGLLSEPSILGMYVVISFFFILLIRKTYKSYSLKVKILPCLLVFILIFTFSRSSQVIFLFGLFILFMFEFNLYQKINRLILVTFFILLVLPFFISPVRQSISEIEKLKGSDNSKVVRNINMITSINVFKNNWLFGVGMGNFGFYYSDNVDRNMNLPLEILATIDPQNMRWPVTNNFVTRIIAELGLVGFLLFSAFYFYIFSIVFRMSVNKKYKPFGIYLLIIFILIVAFNFTNESFQFFIYWFFLGLIVAIYEIMKKEKIGLYENLDAKQV